jgi:hypothetical protein
MLFESKSCFEWGLGSGRRIIIYQRSRSAMLLRGSKKSVADRSVPDLLHRADFVLSFEASRAFDHSEQVLSSLQPTRRDSRFILLGGRVTIETIRGVQY